jgi:hypothetical protein
MKIVIQLKLTVAVLLAFSLLSLFIVFFNFIGCLVTVQL